MGYRIMEINEQGASSLDGAIEIASYDSAYEAISIMKQARERNRSTRSWYLVDQDDQILARPEDLDDIAIAS